MWYLLAFTLPPNHSYFIHICLFFSQLQSAKFTIRIYKLCRVSEFLRANLWIVFVFCCCSMLPNTVKTDGESNRRWKADWSSLTFLTKREALVKGNVDFKSMWTGSTKELFSIQMRDKKKQTKPVVHTGKQLAIF